MKIRHILLISIILILGESKLLGQLMDKGVKVVGLKVNDNDFGQGTLFKRNKQILIVTAKHVINGAFKIDVISERNRGGGPADSYEVSKNNDIGIIDWSSEAYLSKTRHWKIPKNYRNIIAKKKGDFRIFYRGEDGSEKGPEVIITEISLDSIKINFSKDAQFEEGMSGGALVLRPKSGRDIYLGMLLKRSNNNQIGIVLPADLMHDEIKRQMKPIEPKNTRLIISSIGLLGTGVTAGIGYFTSYKNASKIYDLYQKNPQESVFAGINTGFSTREAAYKEAEDLRKKTLRTYYAGAGIAVATVIYRIITRPEKVQARKSNKVELGQSDEGISLTYSF